jgi:hypothetical protein
MLALTVLSLSFWPAAAQNKDGSIELSAMYSWIRFDGDGALDDRIMPSFLLGYNFTKRHGTEIMWSTGTATPDRGDPFAVDIDILRTGYVFNAYPSQKIVSFFRFGMGLWNQDVEDHTGGPSRLQDDDTNFMLYSGGGARFFMTSWMAVRFAGAIDLIAIEHGLLNGDSELSFDLGLSFLFGGREAPEDQEPPAEEPPKEGAKP